MRFVPRVNVRSQLTFTILIAILLSWTGSTGLNNYLTYRQYRLYRSIMLANPSQYTSPIPLMHFGVREFFLGYPPRLPRTVNRRNSRTTSLGALTMTPGQLEQDRTWMSATALLALFIALSAGAWASRRFTRPLSVLMLGANEISDGNYGYAIDLDGDSEFAELATTLNQVSAKISSHVSQLEHQAVISRHFTADIAHELRTPMSTIKTMAEALGDGMAEDPQRRSRAISSIAQTSDRLLRLISDMLVLAKLDLKELPLHIQPVDIRELANSCVQGNMVSASTAHVTLKLVDDGPPIMVEADPDRIAQTLDNLIGNAISHAGTGAEISVTIVSGSSIRVIVEDNGCGIAPECLPYIGAPFYRPNTARSPDDVHSGLGLSIARAFVEAHGGTLAIDSRLNQGTKVSFHLKSLVGE